MEDENVNRNDNSEEKDIKQNKSSQKGIQFYPQLPSWAIELLNTKQAKSILTEEQLYISRSDQYEQTQVELILSLVKSNSCIQIYKWSCIQTLPPNLPIQFLTHTHFTNLIDLQISWSGITNIEGLQFVDMPSLERLQLRNNRISRGHAINKCMWKFLKFLSLFYNSMKENNLSRFYVPNQQNDENAKEIFLRIDQYGGDMQLSETNKLNVRQVDLWASWKVRDFIEHSERKMQVLQKKYSSFAIKKYRA